MLCTTVSERLPVCAACGCFCTTEWMWMQQQRGASLLSWSRARFVALLHAGFDFLFAHPMAMFRQESLSTKVKTLSLTAGMFPHQPVADRLPGGPWCRSHVAGRGRTRRSWPHSIWRRIRQGNAAHQVRFVVSKWTKQDVLLPWKKNNRELAKEEKKRCVQINKGWCAGPIEGAPEMSQGAFGWLFWVKAFTLKYLWF